MGRKKPSIESADRRYSKDRTIQDYKRICEIRDCIASSSVIDDTQILYEEARGIARRHRSSSEISELFDEIEMMMGF